MTIKKLQMVFLGCLITTTALAGSRMRDYYNESSWPIVATLSVGPGWARPGETQTLTLQPQIEKAYVPNPTSRALRFVNTTKHTDTLAAGEFFLGLYGDVNSVVEGQLGLAFGMSSQARLGGTIYEDADPAFNNYSYSYKIRNSRIGVKIKALYKTGYYDVIAYLSGCAAVGTNNSARYRIAPLLDTEVPSPFFSNNNSTTLSYNFAVGVEAPVDPNWRVGLGYEYANWGKSQLARAPEQTVGSGLTLGNLRVQELMVSLTYIM